jgi:diguanylate cyclase (GGDEF)-like protein
MTSAKVRMLITVLLLVLFSLVVSIFSFRSDLWTIDNPGEQAKLLDSGWDITRAPDDSGREQILMKHLFMPADAVQVAGGPTLFFRTLNMRVKVLVDGRRVYSFGYNGHRIVGSESGAALHFIRLTRSDDRPFTVTILLSNSSRVPHHHLFLPAVYYGSKAACVFQYLMACLPAGLLSIAIILVGLVGLFLTAAIYISRKQFVRDYLFWGLFALVSGCGFFIESGAADLIIPNSFFLYFLSTLFPAAAPAFFLQYVNECKTLPYEQKISTFFSTFSYFLCAVVCIGAFVVFIPFGYIKTAVFIALIAFIFFIIAITINEAVSITGKLAPVNALLIITGGAIIADLTLYLFPPYPVDAFRFARPCFLIFIIVRSIYVVNDFYNVQILTARKDMYEDAVSRDVLTGTRTRPSFWKTLRELLADEKESSSRILLVLCEMSNLKEINDTSGFSAGDDALKNVAGMLRQNFPANSLYRFEGNGFCMLFSGFSDAVIAHKLNDLSERLAEYNQGTADQVVLSFGKCRFNSEQDGTLERFVMRTQRTLNENRLSEQKKK